MIKPSIIMEIRKIEVEFFIEKAVKPIRLEERPPKPFNKAIICGRFFSFILDEKYMLIVAPSVKGIKARKSFGVGSFRK